MESLNQKLKDHQLRATQARKDIYKLLKESSVSLSPKEVFKSIVEKSNTDLVSVYRNLSLFSDLGLAHRFQDGKYSRCEHQHTHNHDHIHFINRCTHCGKSSEIKTHSKEICQLAKKLKNVSNLLSTYDEIVIQGRCDQCSLP